MSAPARPFDVEPTISKERDGDPHHPLLGLPVRSFERDKVFPSGWGRPASRAASNPPHLKHFPVDASQSCDPTQVGFDANYIGLRCRGESQDRLHKRHADHCGHQGHDHSDENDVIQDAKPL